MHVLAATEFTENILMILVLWIPIYLLFYIQEPERQYMHIGTMVEFAFALVAKLDVINKHSFNDFKLRIGMWHKSLTRIFCKGEFSVKYEYIKKIEWYCH